MVEFVLEIQYKLRAVVRNNRLRSAVDLVNIINIYIGHILCSCGFKIRERDSLFI